MKKLGENDKRNSFKLNVESWIEFLILFSGLAKCSQLTAHSDKLSQIQLNFRIKTKKIVTQQN